MLFLLFSGGAIFIQTEHTLHIINIPDTLRKEHIRKWVDRVLIENTEKVEVILPKKYTDWRDMLPAVWIKERE